MQKSYSITLQEIFYYLFFALLLFAKGIGLYDGQPLFKVFLVTAMLCYVMKMIMTSFSVKEIIIIALLLLLGGIVYICSGEKGIFLYMMMVTGLKNISVRRVFYVGFFTWILSFGILFVLTVTHIIESQFKVHDKFGLGFLIRWSLGYAHPNVLHVSYLTFVLLAVYLLKQRFNRKWFLLFMAGNCYVFLYSLSSTGLIAVTFFLCLCLYWHYRKKLSAVEKILIQLCLPIFAGVSLIAPMILEGRVFEIVNKIVNTRLYLSKYFLNIRPISWFGTYTADITTPMFTMDNSYLFAYVTYGIVLFCIIFLAYIKIIHKYCKEQKGTELGILLASLAAGVTEPFLFNSSFKNISLLFFSELIFSEKGNENQFRILAGKNRTWKWILPSYKGAFQIIKEIYDQNLKKICLTVVTGALLGGVSFGILSPRIEYIAVPRQVCDSTEQESFYVESPMDLWGERIRVLGYIDGETEMVTFGGNTVKAEQIRGVVTGGVMTGAMTGIVLLGILYVRRRKIMV